MPDTKVAFDPVLGRIATPAAQAAPNLVEVLFHDAFPGDVGGGTYERAASFAEALTPLVPVSLGGNLQTALGSVQAGGVVELGDSERYNGTYDRCRRRRADRAARRQWPAPRAGADRRSGDHRRGRERGQVNGLMIATERWCSPTTAPTNCAG